MTNFTYSTAALDRLKSSDREIFDALMHEEVRQSDGIELIPSENYCFPEVYALLGSVFNNKYSEGYPGRRYYGGQENTDIIENLARDRAKALFRAEHANVQPLRAAQMNEAVYFGLLQPGDTDPRAWICRMAAICRMAVRSPTWRRFSISCVTKPNSPAARSISTRLRTIGARNETEDDHLRPFLLSARI